MFLEIYNSFRMEMNSGTILGYFLQAIPITIVVGILYAVCRLVFLKRRNGKIAWMSETMRLLFVCYRPDCEPCYPANRFLAGRF